MKADRGEEVLTQQDVKEIRVLCAQGTMARRKIGEMYGDHSSNTTLIAKKKTWKHVPWRDCGSRDGGRSRPLF